MRSNATSGIGAIDIAGTQSRVTELSWLTRAENVAPSTGTSVCVIGGGFVGLVTAACLAQTGHSVVCVEKDAQRAADLSAGRIPIYEQSLPQLVRANLERDRLRFTTDLRQAVAGQDILVITVGTPSGADGRADLTALDTLISDLGPILAAGQIVTIKSTVPVGTAARVRRMLNPHDDGAEPIPVVSNPEFLREGTAVYDFFHPQRVVVGASCPDAADRVVQTYRAGLARPAPIVVTSNETAELIKYASNVYLATRLSFVNELSSVCDALAIDIGDVAYAMGLDPRIGAEYFDAGPGFGGSCLPKDLDAFISFSERNGAKLELAPAVKAANERQLERVLAKIRLAAGGSLAQQRIGILGLSFKAQTQDMRDSPAKSIIEMLLQQQALVQAYDPVAMDEARRVLPQITLCHRAEDVASGASVVAVMTEWPEFQLLDWRLVHDRMLRPVIVDARNHLSPETLQRAGFEYIGMGRR
ncbi:MAG TPA: UDP-glucose/GDP-mannose dehydrogenase family protein [bacterium]|nr:UDP-glucose/GDP-mannose dehydrogenase family protein [bacterium]